MRVEQWDDLRVVLAVARGGTLTAAAAQLGCDQTTVTRRVRSIEERLGLTLFDRLRGGAELTELGAAFVRTAEGLEGQVLELERMVSGADDLLAGRVRVTVSEVFAYTWMSEFTAFAEENPALDVELVVGNSLSNLTRREADIAIRATASPAEHLVGRRIAEVALAVYGGPKFVAMEQPQWHWIGWDPAEVAVSATDQWRRRLGGGQYRLWVNSYLTLLEAARCHAGVVVLPCATGDAIPSLVRLTEPEIMSPLWLLTHPDLRRSPRIRLALDRLTEFLVCQRAALDGTRRVGSEEPS